MNESGYQDDRDKSFNNLDTTNNSLLFANLEQFDEMDKIKDDDVQGMRNERRSTYIKNLQDDFRSDFNISLRENKPSGD